MTVKLGCQLNYQVTADTVFVFNVEAARLAANANLQDSVTLNPNANCEFYDTPDTRNRYMRVSAAPGPFSLRYEAELELKVVRADPQTIPEVPVGNLPLALLPYLLPTRFVPSDRAAGFAQAEFGQLPQGHQRVSAICNWINDHIAYIPGSSDAETTAAEVIMKRSGVCRDFAHLGITFCRALGIPARYVTCYAFGLAPADFHAVFEAYLGNRWWLFDPIRQAALDRLVRIGVGRDAAEVAFATLFGAATASPPEVWINRSDRSPADMWTTEAISLEAPS
jgi:transglutaminase-like putative cysteine protease